MLYKILWSFVIYEISKGGMISQVERSTISKTRSTHSKIWRGRALDGDRWKAGNDRKIYKTSFEDSVVQTRPPILNERLNPSARIVPRFFRLPRVLWNHWVRVMRLPVPEIRKRSRSDANELCALGGLLRSRRSLKDFLHRQTQPYMASSMTLCTSRSHLLFILSITSRNLFSQLQSEFRAR